MLLRHSVYSNDDRTFAGDHYVTGRKVIYFTSQGHRIQRSNVKGSFYLAKDGYFRVVPRVHVKGQFRHEISTRRVITLRQYNRLYNAFHFQNHANRPVRGEKQQIRGCTGHNGGSRYRGRDSRFSFRERASFVCYVIIRVGGLLHGVQRLDGHSAVLCTGWKNYRNLLSSGSRRTSTGFSS